MIKPGRRLNLTRMVRLARLSVADDWRPYWLTALIMGGLVFISGLAMRTPAKGFLLGVMLLIGMVLTSRLFSGLQKREKGIYLSMIPASIPEKFLIQWLASLVGYFVLSILAISIGGTLSNLVAGLMYDSAAFAISYPGGLWQAFKAYFFFHSIFFAGALFFKGNNFLKTTLVLIGISIVVTMGSVAYLKNSLMSFGYSSFHVEFNGLNEFYRFIGGPSMTLLYYTRVAAFIGVPVLMYLISYIRFKNHQIKG